MYNKILNFSRKIKYPFLSHEGMTSHAERMNLYRMAACLRSGQVVELGPYFGASTAALYAGLDSASMPRVRIHVYDSFRTREDSYFARRVAESARRSGTQRLLLKKEGWLHWDRCFEELCAPFLDSIVVTKSFFQDASWTEEPIGLLHIDMPKDYETGRHVFTKLFPSLQPGSIILFQDFVYHWSAEMIAAFGFLMHQSLLRPISITSDTLTLECAVSGHTLLNRLNDHFAADPDETLKGVAYSIEAVSGIADVMQLSVLEIAFCQALHKSGRQVDALGMLGRILRENSRHPKVVRGVYEVLERRFERENSC